MYYVHGVRSEKRRSTYCECDKHNKCTFVVITTIEWIRIVTPVNGHNCCCSKIL